jgi:archaellin
MQSYASRLSQWFLILVLCVGSFAAVSAVQAKTAPASTDAPKSSPSMYPPSEEVAGAANCFDYYQFGSVQADIEGTVNSTVSGVPIHFQGNIKNNNDYPVVGGALYAKVFRKQTDTSLISQNGHNLVDQFFVKDNLSISAKGQTPVEFDWQVPAYAASGEYQIAFFFTSDKKFNLLGLSFTDDVVGNVFNFTVAGDQKSVVAFNKNTVKIGDGVNNSYRFAAFPPKQANDKDIPVTMQLTNPTNATQTVTIAWKLYGWDAQSEDNLLNNTEANLTLKPKETKTLQYLDTNRTNTVHLLVAQASYKDTTSILDIRYVRDGVDTIRLNFPAVMQYPLEQNKEAAVFSCVHNAGLNTVQNNKLTLTLKDQDGKEIHTYTYDGAVSSAMMAVKDTFTPTQTYQDFSLEAKLYHDGTLVDEATMQYDCKSLNQDACPNKTTNTGGLPLSLGSLGGGTLLKVIIAIGVALLLLLIMHGLRPKKATKRNRMKVIVFALMFVSGLGLGNVKGVEAKSLVWNTGSIPNLCSVDMMFLTTPVLNSATGNITYNAQITNVDTGAIIPDASTVPVGTKLKFASLPHLDTDISWVGTGVAYDTPYGTWRSGASRPPSALPYYLGMSWRPFILYDLFPPYSIFIPLSVNPPTDAMTPGSNLSCDAAGVCTVTAAGSVSASVAFAPTYGKFYYAWGYSPNSVKLYKPDALQKCTLGDFEVVDRTLNVVGKYQLTVPTQSINFTLTAVQSNNPPTDPIITPSPASGTTGISLPFTVVSTDPENDQLKYEIDWDNNGTTDAFTPTSGYVASGAPQTTAKIWTVPGVYTFKVRATDNRGASSGWTADRVTIINPINPCTETTWTPDPSGVCTGLIVSQTSNCSTLRNVPGTKICNNPPTCKNETWSPDPSGVCANSAVSQTSSCGNARIVSGKKACPSNWKEIAPIP